MRRPEGEDSRSARPEASAWARASLLTMAWAVMMILAPSLLFAAEIHIVQKGDTLAGIAREHGLGVGPLIEANALGKSGHIRIGQRLKIPDVSGRRSSKSIGSSTAAPSSGLDRSLVRLLERQKVEAGRWKHIVIHHSATRMGDPRGMDRYHREQRHMENGLAYHFVIGNGRGMGDGQVHIGSRWTRQIKGGHLASDDLNEISLGICLVGDFEKDRPTPRQLQVLNSLTRYLMTRCRLGRSAVKTHQQINTVGTRCPGRYFDDETFLKGLP